MKKNSHKKPIRSFTKKKLWTTTMAILFALLGWQHANAQTFTNGGIVYDVTSVTTVRVALQQGAATGNISIPAQVTDNSIVYSVTSISDFAFSSCTGLLSVIIPNSVTNLPRFCFRECTSLAAVTIPNSITSIGDRAFFNCTSLDYIVIPSSVNSIGDFAFNNCTALTTVVCNIASPVAINANVFQGVNLGSCILRVPNASFSAYQAAPVWQNFSPIQCATPTANSTTIVACNSYTWAINSQTYTVGGTYTNTTNCVTEILNLIINPTPAAPTVTAQTLCSGATVANLVATGTGIKWYSASTGGTALVSTTALTSGNYFASQTINGCESARTSAAITINVTPAAPTATAQIFCNAATVANLVPTGATIKWYAASTGGTALVSTTALATGNYFASQTINGCESARTSVAVTITPTPAAPTAIGTQVYTGVGTIANLTATGSSIQWYNTANAGAVLPTTTVLVDGAMYYASQSAAGGCESTVRTAVTVRKISEATQTLCAPATVATLLSTPSIGTTANWFTTAIGGTAILNTAPLSTGTYYVEQSNPLTITTLGSGFFRPEGVSKQADGKILVPDTANNAIKRMNADGTGIVTLGSGFSFPRGVAVQADGKILVADTNNSAIKRMNVDGTGIVILGSGFSFPWAVAVDADGKILVADSFNNTIKRMNADGTGIVTIGTGFSRPRGVAVQADGKILVADYSNSAIKRMNADGTGIVTLGSGFSFPQGVDVQADGKILVAETTNNAIKRMNADGSGIVSLGSGFSFAYGVAVQGAGNILVADRDNNAIKRLSEATLSNRVAVNVTVNTTSAPTATVQTFCSGATVASLVATGTGIKWYATSTGGTALAGSTALTTGNYFASQTISGCESASRTAVAVTVNATSAPIAAAQTFCNTATVANLVATGTGIKWYSAATGGSALDSAIALTNGNYFASQTISGCESASRASVAVTLNTTSAPTAAAQSFCNTATVANLLATGTGIKWYSASTGGVALAGPTALTTGNYFASQTISGCESTSRASVAVTVTPAAAIDYTVSQALGVLTANQNGASYQWFQCPSTLLSGETNQNFTPTLAGDYKVDVTLSGCTVVSSCITVTTLGNQTFAFNSKLSVYPNPSSDVFSINSDVRCSVVVYDLIGKIIKSEIIDLGITKLDLSNYPSGIYLMKVTNDNNETKTIKIVKQ